MSKKEVFKAHVKKILLGFEYRAKIVGMVIKDSRTVKTWIESDNPGLMTDDVVAYAMTVMGALDRSDVTEWIEETETANV